MDVPGCSVFTVDDSGRVSSAPPVPGTFTEPGLIVYRFGAGVFYANAERFSEEIRGLVELDEPPRWLVLDAASIDDLDYTGGKTLAELVDQLGARGVSFAVAEAGSRLKHELDAFGVTEKIGQERVFDTVQEAIEEFRKSG